jgi:NAD(P)-dependent dehydrogenase (short-subunit alcohol dehydrogenase family)
VARLARSPGSFGDAEVDDLHLTFVDHEDVVRGDVAMDDVERRTVEVLQLVRVVNPLEDVQEDTQVEHRWELFAAAREDAMHRLTIEILHGQEVLAVYVADLERLDEIRMIQARRDASFVDEHRHELDVVREVVLHPLDDDELGEDRALARHREVDVGHAALPQLGDDAVLPQSHHTRKIELTRAVGEASNPVPRASPVVEDSLMSSLEGKTVFITGAARGVGAEVARRLDAIGAKVVAADVDEAALKELSAGLDPKRTVAKAGDVRDLGAMQAVVDEGKARFGGIDVVIANAGIGTYGSVLQVDPEAFRRLIEVNVIGVFNTVRAALPSIIERRGYVLIVSSLAAYAPAPGMAPYDCAKAGVEHFANALRLEVAHQGVDVGSAHMSWIDTPLVRETKDDLSTFREMLAMLPGPLRKTTSVEECGEAFIRGIERRSRQINCPSWVGALRWLKPFLSSSVGESQLRKSASRLMPRMDAEVAELGRSLSARTEGLGKR